MTNHLINEETDNEKTENKIYNEKKTNTYENITNGNKRKV